jgi:hypothetical protein
MMRRMREGRSRKGIIFPGPKRYGSQRLSDEAKGEGALPNKRSRTRTMENGQM